MEWFFWALLSALFAGATAILAKIGVADVNSNLATAIRTSVILIFSWGIAIFTTNGSSIVAINKKAWIMLVLSGLATGSRGYVISERCKWGKSPRLRPSIS
jgi:bacterial/archaeal transporter family protein